MDQNKSPVKKRILVVEDEEVLRKLYAQILREAGYEVVEAEDGEKGYDSMLEGGFDLVLLDIMLPKMTGLQILEKLKKGPPPKKPNHNIVILTSIGQDETIAKGLAYGVRGYMIKSDYTPDQILKEVNTYLNS